MRRTQIYLTDDQLASLRRSAGRRGTSMADLIRTAVDAFLRRDAAADPDEVLSATVGKLPDLEVPPRSEWDRRVG